MAQPKLKLVAPDDARAEVDPIVTETGGTIHDTVVIPPASRGRVERIHQASTSIRPLAGTFTTRSAVVRAKAALDIIIAQATALRAEL